MMNRNPEISVIMSVYNGEKHLRESVDSILNQTFQDFEFIIINDGSTDRSKDILESFKDDRIKLLHHKNKGLTKSLNIGIAIGKGKYIARQDADDISKPERFEKQLAFMDANPLCALISSSVELIDAEGIKMRICELPVEDGVIKEKLIEINQFCHGAAMIKKEALDKVGVYRDFFKYAQDYDLWLRISEYYEVANIAEPLYCYRVLDDAISSKKMLLQTRYAGTAIKQALLRRTTGRDQIQQGIKPTLSSVGTLSLSLKEKLLQYYEVNRFEMLREKRIGRFITDTVMYYRIKL